MFQTCANGHDLTVPGARVYKPNGWSFCRLCEFSENDKSTKNKKKIVQRGTFNGSTWAEKRGENMVRKV